MGIRKRGDIWYIDYYAGGGRHVEAVGPSKKDAEAALGGIKKDIREGRWFPRKMRIVPFEDLVEEYDRMAKPKKGYRSEIHYIEKVKEYFKGRMVGDLTTLDVERFRNDRKETPVRGKTPRSGAAVNRELATLRAMLNKAVQWGMIERNPASRVKMFPEPPGRNCFLKVEEAGRLLDACHPHIRSIVLCALETGMRKSEITGLKWSEIRNGMIYLPGSRTKNGKPREIPISERLSEEFKRLRRQALQAGGATDVVFKAHRGRPSEDGTRRLKVLPSPVKSFRSAWDAATEKAGIAPGFHFHDLRHTFASHQKMAGVDDYTLMEIMGHSDFTMMKRYAHLTPEHKRKAIEMLPEWKAGSTGDKTVTNEG